MTEKLFKSKFLHLSDNDKKAVIDNLKFAIAHNETKQGTKVKAKDKLPSEKLLAWCEVRTASQPDLTFLG